MQFKHHIRTAFGTSTSTTSNTTSIPYQGICQGNGAGPTIWVAVSTPLLEMMRTAGNQLSFEAPLSKGKDSIVGFAFVDDTDIVQGDLTVDLTYAEVHKAAQEGIDRWEGGLKATGGAIRPDKSFVYPIDFAWDAQGRPSFLEPNEIALPLTVKDEHEQRHTLRQISPPHWAWKR